MFYIGMYDQGSILHAAEATKVGSITLEHDVQRLLPGGQRSGIHRPFSMPVHADEQCILEVSMKRIPNSAQPEETS